MADLFLAYKRSRYGLVRRAVIKRVRRSAPSFKQLQQMLLDEARALAHLEHPNVVSLLDVGEDDQGVYLALEYVDGTDLRQINGRLRARKEALPFELGCYVTLEVLRGLHYAHTAVGHDGRPMNIVHRDVNPSNVLVSFTGHVKLTDFGVVHMRERIQDTTEAGLVKGKFAYISPEYIAGEPCSVQSDIYAAGVMLFELLTGRECFSGATPYEIMWKIVNRGVPLRRLEREGVPEELYRIVQRATSGAPERRHATAQELANGLEGWLMRSGRHATPWVLATFFSRHDLYPTPRAPGAPALAAIDAGARALVVEVDPASAPEDQEPDEHQTEAESRSAQAAAWARALEESFSPALETRYPAFFEASTDDILDTDSLPGPLATAEATPVNPPSAPPSLPSSAPSSEASLRKPLARSNSRSSSAPPARLSSSPGRTLLPRPGSISPDPSAAPAPPPAPTAVALPSFSAPSRASARPDVPPSSLPAFSAPARNPSSAAPESAGLAPPSPPTTAPSPIASPWRGKLEEISAAKVLGELARSASSGSLEFRCGLIWKRVRFDQGAPVGIMSNMGMELIGEHLVKARLIERSDLDRALHAAERDGQPVTVKFLELGLLDRETLEDELGKNLAARLTEVLEWHWGVFEFLPEAPQPATIRPRLDLAALVTASARAREDAPEGAREGEDQTGVDPAARLKQAVQRARSIAESSGKGRIEDVGPPKTRGRP